MKWLKKSSIRRGGTILVAVLVTAFSLYAYFSGMEAYRFFEKNSKNKLMTDANYIAAEIDGFADKYVSIVEQMATNSDFITLMEEVDDKYKKRENPLYKDVSNQFAKIKATDQNISLVYIAFLSSNSGGGLITDDYYYDAKDNYNLSARSWYMETIANKETTVTNPYIDYVTGKPVLSIAKPYYKDGKDEGAFAIDVMIDDIYKMMGNYSVGETGYTVLFNSKGNLLYHPDVDMEILLQENPGYIKFSEFNEIMLDGKAHLLDFKDKTQEYYIASVPLKNTDWVVATVIPKREVLLPIQSYMSNNFWMLLAVIALVAIFIRFMTNLISEPIVNIANEIELFGKGEHSIRFSENYYEREDEIGILANGLDNMARSIEDYISEINEKNKILLEEIENRKTFQEKLELMLKLLSSTEEGIFIVNENLKCIYSNTAFEKLTGYNELALKNMNLIKTGIVLNENIIDIADATGNSNGEIEYKKGEDTLNFYIKLQRVEHDADYYYIGNVIDITSYKQKELELYRIQHFDSLTGLYNKESFKDLTQKFLEQQINKKLKHAVIMVDIDNFRLINEAKGFDFGNKVLISIARDLEQHVEESDLLARLGDDEFIVLKTNIKNEEDIYSYVLELFKNMNKSHIVSGEELFINLRFGVSIYPTDALDYEMLLKNATSALNSVKNRAGNSFAFYNKDMNDKSIYKYELKNKLKNAIDAGEMVLYYQPQIDVKSSKIVGMEALIRWKTSNEIIPPNIFIPIAEEYNLIVQLGEWVLYKACEFGYRLYEMGYNIQVAVNLSRAQFKNPYINILVNSILEKTQFPHHLLELEITESILMENEEECEVILENFRNMGIKTAIDDFGTGYSSLSYLKKFAVDKIKIDRAFIKDIPHSDNGAIARVIIDLARILNIEVIAEGVEEEDHVNFLKENSCPQAQGFFFSKPVPEDDIIKFIEENLKS